MHLKHAFLSFLFKYKYIYKMKQSDDSDLDAIDIPMDLLYKSQFLYDTPKCTIPPLYKF